MKAITGSEAPGDGVQSDRLRNAVVDSASVAVIRDCFADSECQFKVI